MKKKIFLTLSIFNVVIKTNNEKIRSTSVEVRDTNNNVYNIINRNLELFKNINFVKNEEIESCKDIKSLSNFIYLFRDLEDCEKIRLLSDMQSFTIDFKHIKLTVSFKNVNDSLCEERIYTKFFFLLLKLVIEGGDQDIKDIPLFPFGVSLNDTTNTIYDSSFFNKMRKDLIDDIEYIRKIKYENQQIETIQDLKLEEKFSKLSLNHTCELYAIDINKKITKIIVKKEEKSKEAIVFSCDNKDGKDEIKISACMKPIYSKQYLNNLFKTNYFTKDCKLNASRLAIIMYKMDTNYYAFLSESLKDKIKKIKLLPKTNNLTEKDILSIVLMKTFASEESFQSKEKKTFNVVYKKNKFSSNNDSVVMNNFLNKVKSKKDNILFIEEVNKETDGVLKSNMCLESWMLEVYSYKQTSMKEKKDINKIINYINTKKYSQFLFDNFSTIIGLCYTSIFQKENKKFLNVFFEQLQKIDYNIVNKTTFKNSCSQIPFIDEIIEKFYKTYNDTGYILCKKNKIKEMLKNIINQYRSDKKYNIEKSLKIKSVTCDSRNILCTV